MTQREEVRMIRDIMKLLNAGRPFGAWEKDPVHQALLKRYYKIKGAHRVATGHHPLL